MNISRFFVDRPIFAGVLSVLIFIAGLLAMFQLPISEYPEVAPPSVVITASYPGANPKVIAATVATPLEEQLSGVENMLYMFSQGTSDGRMALTVTFKIGTDPRPCSANGSESCDTGFTSTPRRYPPAWPNGG